MTVQPTGDYILIQVDPDDERVSPGGIIIPRGIPQHKMLHTGTVVGVGPGRVDPNDSNKLVPMVREAGDRVLFARHAGHPFESDGRRYLIVKDNDPLCLVLDEGSDDA